MSTAEILARTPLLSADERAQVLELLVELQENDLLQGIGPTAEETKLLDEALADSNATAMKELRGARPCARSARGTAREPHLLRVSSAVFNTCVSTPARKPRGTMLNPKLVWSS